MHKRLATLATIAALSILPAAAHAQTLAVSSKVSHSRLEPGWLYVSFKESGLTPGQSVNIGVDGLADCGFGPETVGTDYYNITANSRGTLGNSLYITKPEDCAGRIPTYSSMRLCDETNLVCVDF
jgi:hypothetical protein